MKFFKVIATARGNNKYFRLWPI